MKPVSGKAVTDADRLIGHRIASLRRAKGYSQLDLAQVVGVSSQQIHKYETGLNRTKPNIIRQIAATLGVTITGILEPPSKHQADLFAEAADLLFVDGAHALLKAYATIQDTQLQQEILAVVKSFVRLQRSDTPTSPEKPTSAEPSTAHRRRIRGQKP